MTKKKGKHPTKKQSSIASGNTKYYLIIIVVIIIASAGIIALQSQDNQETNTTPSSNDGTWIFALDTSTERIGSKEAYRTGYIPTLVIIDIDGNIIHKSAGVHTKQELMDLVEEAQQTTTNTESAPDFTLDTFGGKQFKLSDYKGTPVILDLMAVRCPPCHQQMPILYDLKKELGNDVVILSIDVDAASGSENQEDVREAFGEYISEE